MGDLIDLTSRMADAFDDKDPPDFDAFLMTEGLELLAKFRSIDDPEVRQSIVQMVSRIASALNAGSHDG